MAIFHQLSALLPSKTLSLKNVSKMFYNFSERTRLKKTVFNNVNRFNHSAPMNKIVKNKSNTSPG